MALIEVLGYPYITYNQDYSRIHWKEAAYIIRNSYGYVTIREPSIVKEALLGINNYFLQSISEIINEHRSLKLLLYIHKLHESSIFIASEKDNNIQRLRRHFSSQNIVELSSVRRVLKLLMEEIITENFNEEVNEKLIIESISETSLINIIEELLYLGMNALQTIEQINITSFFKYAVYLKSSKKDGLTVYIKNPFKDLIEYTKNDMQKYPNRYYNNINEELEDKLKEHFGINISEFQKSLPKSLGSYLISKEDFIKEQTIENRQAHKLEDFYEGLIINSSKKIPLEQSFLKMQENNRLMYRPIIEFKDINGNQYWLLGSGKTSESLHALRSNAILWGKLPNEWKQERALKQLEDKAELYREESMNELISNILNKYNLIYDKDISTLYDNKGKGYRIDTEAIGQIDLIIINEEHKRVFICECKNNRPRYDLYYWKSDHDQFSNSSKKRNYEKQLTNKHQWASNNTKLIESHFNYSKQKNYDFSEWTVEGMFILMSPSIYKNDGLFTTLTIEDLENFIINDFTSPYEPFNFIHKSGKEYLIEYPYLKNTNILFEKGLID
ncbi:hypothetical protein [Rufibacter roseolus]|uniref:hypothetical protein n=1 Tax=Rufibacter roseolus TaxID=2817375 RepID=UPI001B3063CB|nr:hypothetical protein [Rufibacter roseolus]